MSVAAIRQKCWPSMMMVRIPAHFVCCAVAYAQEVFSGLDVEVACSFQTTSIGGLSSTTSVLDSSQY